ncbi:MAG: KTSC domain-containing protein, partial [Kiritimatiellia bacterium]|nr:KTSC domain-containing protein [Kiritimatiellia bacterium]
MKHVARLLVGVLAGLMLSACVSSGPNLDPGPETSFQPIRTETLFSIRYKPEERELTVVLRTGDVIDYADVPPEAAEGLLNA